MLESLNIRNLALVDNVSACFGPGLNIITGETGAGKSLLVGALALVLGERADKTVVRSGADECSVAAEFLVSDVDCLDARLAELGFAPVEEGRLIVRRTVSASGGSRSFLNDSPVTLQALRLIGDLLVDMHGPHDHQSLLHRESQLDILDVFAGLDRELEKYASVYNVLVELKREYKEISGPEDGLPREQEMLEFQVQEIGAADISVEEEDEIQVEHRTLSNSSRITELCSAAVNALSESDDSIFDRTAELRNCLEEVADLSGSEETWVSEAESISIQAKELASSIASYLSGIDGDPARLEWLDERLAIYDRLKRKYGGSTEAVLDFLASAEARLQEIAGRGERLVALEKRIAEQKKTVEKAASGLTRKRKTAASRLARGVVKHLRDLAFANSEFCVAFESIEPHARGGDSIDFRFSPNPGEPERDLKAVASSGEISRVMLAIKAVLADSDRIPVLVFDEIDVNVGGKTGKAVGEKLSGIAGGRQVLCITHLPQVASQAASHYCVSKKTAGGRTTTSIVLLDKEQRVDEIARMLGGTDMTSVTRKHAREMLEGRKRS